MVELLVVVIIIGVLASIATPTFLAQANKARGAEARNNLGVINRTQVAYYTSESEFADSLEELDIGLPEKSNNYTYDVTASKTAANATATPNNDQINGYASAVLLTGNNRTATVLCESDEAGATPNLIIGGGAADLVCPSGSEEVK